MLAGGHAHFDMGDLQPPTGSAQHRTVIILVRHGETAGNQHRILQVPEIPLNQTGMEQAERLAERLVALRPRAVLCSDLTRARMTAEPIVRLTGIPIEYSELLQERNFGDVRGTPYAALGFDPFMLGYHPPGGESWDMFHERAARAFAQVVSRRRALGDNLVVVTHGLVCGDFLARHAQLEDGCALPDRVTNTSVSLIDPEAPHVVRLLNCSRHLATVAQGGGAA